MKLYTADVIKEQVYKLLCKDCEETDVCPVCDYRELIDEILDAPTVDAVPVVRCRDCKRHENGPCANFKDDFYCGWGERREDAD